jgi:hypothetical protein
MPSASVSQGLLARGGKASVAEGWLWAHAQGLDEQAVERLMGFFQKYGDMVRFHAARTTRELIQSPKCPSGAHAIAAGQPLHEYALRWLLGKTPGVISRVCVGMPREEYVRDVVRIVSGG